HAAAVLAENRVDESSRIFDQRFSLELLRYFGCRRRHQSRHDRSVYVVMPWGYLLGLQNGLQNSNVVFGFSTIAHKQNPSSTMRFWPFICLLESDNRNSSAPIMSSGSSIPFVPQ